MSLLAEQYIANLLLILSPRSYFYKVVYSNDSNEKNNAQKLWEKYLEIIIESRG